MISLADYFGDWYEHIDAVDARKENAEKLLDACSELEALARADGMVFPVNPQTSCQIAGQTYGGFRPQACKQGAPHSAHKEGLAVDIYDPEDEIDEWCLANQNLLERCGIYIEDPKYTPRWSHWSIRRPSSGNRVFLP